MNILMQEAVLSQCLTDAERKRTVAAMSAAYSAGITDAKREVRDALRVLGIAHVDDI